MLEDVLGYSWFYSYFTWQVWVWLLAVAEPCWWMNDRDSRAINNQATQFCHEMNDELSLELCLQNWMSFPRCTFGSINTNIIRAAFSPWHKLKVSVSQFIRTYPNTCTCTCSTYSLTNSYWLAKKYKWII